MLEVLSSDDVRTARARGPMPRRSLLHNMMIVVIALSAVQFGLMLDDSVVIEAVFSLQDLGLLLSDRFTAATQRMRGRDDISKARVVGLTTPRILIRKVCLTSPAR